MKRQSTGDKVVNVIFYIILGFFVILCFYPVWYAFLASFSDPTYINSGKLIILPRGLTFGAYKYALAQRQLWLGYANTILYTVAGTLFGLIVCLPAGYALSRNDLPFRKIIMALFVFTMYFGGGLIPWYMVVTETLGLRDSIWALIIPSLLGSYNILLMRNFIKQCVPNELVESARIDGAGDWRIFLQIVLRLSTPALATIGLFIALGKWNDWYGSMLFIKTDTKHTLQYILYRMVNMANALKNMEQAGVHVEIDTPSETVKLAMAMVATGPVVLVYPFVQRYFVKGLTVGAVKG